MYALLKDYCMPGLVVSLDWEARLLNSKAYSITGEQTDKQATRCREMNIHVLSIMRMQEWDTFVTSLWSDRIFPNE